MSGWLARLLGRAEPVLRDARVADAGALSALHAASFRRGWSEPEMERLLLEASVVADCAAAGPQLAGFILSRRAADEAEILSVAVALRRQGEGLGGRLLERHLRRLAGFGTRTVFLEVEEGNAPARRLYARAGFREAGKRPGYYAKGAGGAAHAMVLRRDLE
jgi:ribosomal-protein-alanine N-acetyltransferase